MSSTIAWMIQKRPSRTGGCAALRAAAAHSASVARVGMVLWGDELVAERVRHRLGPRCDAELAEHARDVTLDRALAEPELGGDLLVRPATGEHAEHFALPPGQRADGRRAAAPPPGEPARECLVQHEYPIGHGPHRVDKLSCGGGLQQVAAYPDVERLGHVRVVVVSAHH